MREGGAKAVQNESPAVTLVPKARGGTRQASSRSRFLLRLQRLAGNRAVTTMVQREDLRGNPQDLRNAAGQQTTAHTAAGMNAAVNAPAAARPGALRGRRFVKPVATHATPLRLPNPQMCPRPELIFEERIRAETGFTQVQGVHGTVDRPIVGNVADNSLYIGNQPRPSDVMQGSIGDCYGLSTITNIAARDPGKIKSMITPDGAGGATVTFFKRVPKAGAPATGNLPTSQVDFLPVDVHVDGQVAVDLWQPGNATAIGYREGRLAVHGAQFIAGRDPIKAEYWAAIAANQVEVHREDTYQMARWVPLLEKAWARFGETYGQYGHGGRGLAGAGEQSATAAMGTVRASGYEAIDGGVPAYVLTAFYGSAAEWGGSGGLQLNTTAFTPGANLVIANQAVVDQLLLLLGRGDAARPGDTTAPIITANTSTDDMIARLLASIPVAVADPDWANVKTRTRNRVLAVQQAIVAHNAAIAAAATPAAAAAAKTAGYTAIAAACRRAVQPNQTFSLLQRPGRSRNMTAIVELILDLVNAGTDHGGTQRNIFGGHSYSVIGFTPAMLAGAAIPSPLPTAAAAKAAFLAQIDPDASVVKLQNPHHGGEPDAMGNAAPSRAGDGASSGAGADGVFTMSLDSFLRNFSRVDSAVFTRT